MKVILNSAKFIKETDKEIDGNNFLVAYDVPIAKTGIQKYSREEIGNADGPPDEMVNVYRDSTAFKNEEVIESFNGIPIVYAHPDNGKVDNINFKNFVVGTVSGVYFKNGDLYAKKLTIIDKEAIINVLSKNTNELSIGFRGSIIKEQGNYNGTPYEFKENVIHANHLALCESGKAGPYYAINSKTKGKKNMDLSNEKMEGDCMNEEGRDLLPKHIADHIEQVVKQKMSKVKPYLHDSEFPDESGHHVANEEEGQSEKEEKHGEHEMKDKSNPDLKESDHKDKDLIHALKNSNKKLNMLISEKNKEISELDLKNVQLEDALREAHEIVKNMAKKINSSNLVNAMTGPDEVFPTNYALSKDLHNSISKAFLLK